MYLHVHITSVTNVFVGLCVFVWWLAVGGGDGIAGDGGSGACVCVCVCRRVHYRE